MAAVGAVGIAFESLLRVAHDLLGVLPLARGVARHFGRGPQGRGQGWERNPGKLYWEKVSRETCDVHHRALRQTGTTAREWGGK